MGKASRVKGRAYEQDVARKLRPIYPEARRGLQFQDGSTAPDVIAGPWHIECKKRKARPNPLAALEQAERDCDPKRVPVAVCKQDRARATVTMRFDDWLELVADAERWRMR
jgi:hypothetical protein